MNVSEFESIDDATQSLISMTQAYQDLDSMQIIDIMNEIGNNYSISTDQLSTALQKSAASLTNAGNDIYQASALITAGNAILQDSDSVAAGMKVVSMRIAGTSAEELAELGEDTDGLVETTVKLEEKVKSLTAVNGNLGVSLTDNNGNLRSTYEILLDIAKIWEDIEQADLADGQNRQTALLEMLAGKNRSNVVASILQNPDVLENVYESAQNAEGSALAENEKYLDSIDGKMQQLTTTAQEFWFNLVDSEAIKGILDFVEGLLDGFVQISKQAGSFKTTLSAILGVILTLKKVSLVTHNKDGKTFKESWGFLGQTFAERKENKKNNKLLPEYKKFEAAYNNAKSAQGDSFNADSFINQYKQAGNTLDEAFINQIGEARDINTEFEASLGKSAKGFGLFSAATRFAGNTLVTFLVQKGIELALHVIDKLVVTTAELQENVNTAMDVYTQKMDEVKDQKKFIAEISEEFETLGKGVNDAGENISLTSDEYERYQDISEQIASQFPKLISHYNNQGKAVLKTKDSVKELTKAYKENLIEAKRVSVYGTQNEDGDFVGGLSESIDLFNRQKRGSTSEVSWNSVFDVFKSMGDLIGLTDFEFGFNTDSVASLYGSDEEKKQLKKIANINTDGSLEEVLSQLYSDDIALNSYLEKYISNNSMVSTALAKMSLADRINDTHRSSISSKKSTTEAKNSYLSDNESQIRNELGQILSQVQADIQAIEFEEDSRANANREKVANYMDLALNDRDIDIEADADIYSISRILANSMTANQVSSQNVRSDASQIVEKLLGADRDKYEDMYNELTKINSNGIATYEEGLKYFGSTAEGTLGVIGELAQEFDVSFERLIQQFGLKNYYDNYYAANRTLVGLWDKYGHTKVGETSGQKYLDRDMETYFRDNVTTSDELELWHQAENNIDELKGEEATINDVIDKYEELKNAMYGTKYSFKDIFATEDVSGTLTELGKLQEKLDKLTNSYQTLKSAVDEYNTTGSLSLSTLESLMSTGTEWLANVELENGMLKMNGEAFYSAAEAQLYAMKVQMAQNLADQVSTITDVASANKFLAATNVAVAGSYDSQTEAIKANALAQLEAKMVQAREKGDYETYDTLLEAYNRAVTMFDNLNTVVNAVDLTKDFEGASEKLSATVSSLKEIRDIRNSIASDKLNLGAISDDTLSSLVEKYPVLENTVIAYKNGVVGAEEELMSKLDQLYQTDIDNYNDYLQIKYGTDSKWWQQYYNNIPDLVKENAKKYGIDLKNYATYNDAKLAIDEKYQELKDKVMRIQEVSDHAQQIVASGNGENLLKKDSNGKYYTDSNGNYQISFGSLTVPKWLVDSATIYKPGRQDWQKIADWITKQQTDKLQNAQNQLKNFVDELYLDFEDYKPDSPTVDDDFFNGSGNPSSSSRETFDWIEVRINKLNEDIENAERQLDNTFATWSSRNSGLDTEISKTKELINFQNQAYDFYTSKANSVGLSKDYISKIQNGTLKIDELDPDTNAVLIEKINKYQEWYDKAEEVKKSNIELQQELLNLDKVKFDNVIAEYDEFLSRLDATSSVNQSQLSAYTSRKAYNLSAISNEYSEENDIERQRIATIQKMYTAASNRLATLTPGSTEWTEVYNQVKGFESDLVESYNNIANNAKSMFDEVSSYYDTVVENIQHSANILNSEISIIESAGYAIQESYYESLLKNSAEEKAFLEQKKKNLTGELQKAVANGSIEEFSPLWYQMQSEINQVDEEILGCIENMVGFEDQIRELANAKFDNLIHALERVNDEANFLIDFMSNEEMYDKATGAITEYGLATAGLHLQNYETYQTMVQSYADKITEIEQKLADDPYNQKLLEDKENYVELQREAILNAEQEKQNVIELAKQGYEAYISSIQETINKIKELHSEEQSEYEYQKSIAEKSKNINNLRKQLMAYDANDSEEAKARVQSLKVSLEEAEQDLEETQYDKFISEQENLMDKVVTDMQTHLDELMQTPEILLQQMIDAVNTESAIINETIEQIKEEYNGAIETATTDFSQIWSTENPISKNIGDIGNTIKDFLGDLTENQKKVDDQFMSITDLFNKILENQGIEPIEVEDPIANTGNAGGNNTPGNTVGTTPSVGTTPTPQSPQPQTPSTPPVNNNTGNNTGNKNNTPQQEVGSFFIKKKDYFDKNKLNVETSIIDRLKKFDFDSSFSARQKYYAGMGLGSAKSYTASASQNVAMINWMRKNGYNQGGTIGKLIGKTKDEGFILAHSGEEVLSIPKLELADSIVSNLMEMKRVNLPNTAGAIRDINSTNNVTMNIDLPNVQDVNGFITELQQNKRFEKIVQAMTIDRIAGKNSLNKLKF